MLGPGSPAAIGGTAHWPLPRHPPRAAVRSGAVPPPGARLCRSPPSRSRPPWGNGPRATRPRRSSRLPKVWSPRFRPVLPHRAWKDRCLAPAGALSVAKTMSARTQPAAVLCDWEGRREGKPARHGSGRETVRRESSADQATAATCSTVPDQSRPRAAWPHRVVPTGGCEGANPCDVDAYDSWSGKYFEAPCRLFELGQ